MMKRWLVVATLLSFVVAQCPWEAAITQAHPNCVNGVTNPTIAVQEGSSFTVDMLVGNDDPSSESEFSIPIVGACTDGSLGTVTASLPDASYSSSGGSGSDSFECDAQMCVDYTQCTFEPASGSASANCNPLDFIDTAYYPSIGEGLFNEQTVNAGDNSLLFGLARDFDLLSIGDTVLIIQMQGADYIDTRDTSYGSNTGTGSGMLNNGNIVAGTYEYAVVAGFTILSPLIGGRVFFEQPLKNSYYHAAGSTSGNIVTSPRSFQMIVVPRFESITISACSTVTAVNWDGFTGGVLPLDADPQTGVITIDGVITMSGKGFRGGYSLLGLDDNRGEGICGRPAFVYSQITGPLQSSLGTYEDGDPTGFAACNAGGKGSFSSGGGGGSNAAAFGGNGGQTVGTPGFGGGVYHTAASNRLIMGGGGGSGGQGGLLDLGFGDTIHAGQTGGGIVILRAAHITGTGRIESNGYHLTPCTGGTCTQAATASGGGGAGGTIALFAADDITGSLTIEVKGGSGGSTNQNNDSAGGAGGGGVAYLVASHSIDPLVTVDASAGTPGENANGAGDGTDGGVATTLSLTQCCDVAVTQPVNVCGPGTIATLSGTCDSCLLVNLLGNACVLACSAGEGVNTAVEPDRCILQIDPVTPDDIVNASEEVGVVFSGSGGEIGDTVVVSINGGAITASAAVDASGNWATPAVDVSSIPNGVISFEATAQKGISTSLTIGDDFIHDNVRPTGLAINTPVEGDDNVSNAEQPDVVVSGTGEDGSVVAIIFSDTVSTITVSAPVSGGIWIAPAVDFSSLNPGTVVITARQTDAAGNAGFPVLHAVLHDPTPPAAPSILTPIAGDDVINGIEDNAIVVSGVAEANAGVTITITDGLGASVSVSTTASSVDGAFSSPPIDLSGLADGVLAIAAVQTDTAGNPSLSSTVIAQHDSMAPAAPTIDSPIAGDNIVNAAEDTSLPISGRGEASATVTITISDGSVSIVGTAMVDGSGIWSLQPNADVSGLAEGSFTVSVSQRDPAGNNSGTTTVALIHDSIAPAGLTIAPISGDDLVSATEDDSVIAEGANAEPTSKIALAFSDGSNTVAIIAMPSGDGTWAAPAVDLSTFNEGSITVTATETDAAGNTGSPVSRPFIHDSIAPAVVSIDTPIAGDDVASNTEDEAIAISGTNAEPNRPVTVVLSDGTASVTVTATADVSGVWSAPTADISGFSEGAVSITATTSDLAGNVSPPAIASILHDTAPPVGLTVDTPIAGDDVVNAAEETAVVVSGNGQDGATVTLSFDDGINTPVTATAVVSAGSWTAPAVDIVSLVEGPITVIAVQEDAFGNSSPPVTNSVIHDSDAPIGLTIAPIAGDDIVNQIEAVAVIVTGLAEANSVVTVAISDGVSPDVATSVTTGTGGSWSTSPMDLSSLNEGALTATAVQRDQAGNVGAPVSRPVVKDTVAPTGIVITTPIEGDDVVNDSEDETAQVRGTGAEPTSDVSVTFDDGTSAVAVSATVSPTGTWNTGDVDISGLEQGTVTITVQETDTAGNVGSVVNAQVGHDSIPPASLAIGPVAGNDVINAAEEGAVVISGIGGEPDSTVDVAITDSVTTIAVSMSVNGDGTWNSPSTDVSVLQDGPVTVTAQETDSAGNVGPLTSRPIVKDTTSPAVLTIDVVAADDVINAAEQFTLVLSGGNGATGDLVAVSVSDGSTTVSATAVVGAGTTWVSSPEDVSSLVDGPVVVTAFSTDSAGNVGPASTRSVVKDTVSPTGLSITTPIAGDDVINANEDASLVISGQGAEPSSTVAVSMSDGTTTLPTTATVGAGGVWFSSPVDVSGLDQGTLTVSAVNTDAAGNVGVPVTVTATLDTTAPAGPTIDTPIEGDNTVSSTEQTSVELTGSVSEANNAVSVTISDGVTTVTAVSTTVGSIWSVAPVDISTLNDGSITITAVESDPAGNASGAVSTMVTLDTLAPAAPVINSPIEGDDIVNDSEDETVEISGTAEAFSTVQVSIDDGSNPSIVQTVPADSVGDWALPATDISGLDDTPNVVITAAARDAAGNTGPIATTLVAHDGNAPVGLSIITPIAGDDIVNDAEDNVLALAGTGAEPTSTVVATVTDSVSTVVRTAVVSPDGTWTASPMDISALNQGTIMISAVETDVGTNAGPSVSTLAQHDSIAPAGPLITLPIEGDDHVNAAEEATVEIIGSGAEQGTVVEVVIDDGLTPVSVIATVAPDGTWTTGPVDVSGTNQGPLTVSATETDAGGNVSPTDTATAIHDSISPVGIQIITPIEGDDVVAMNEQTSFEVSGNGNEATSTVLVVVRETSGLGSIVTSAVVVGTTWNIPATDITGLSDGPLTIEVVETDQAGNVGPRVAASVVKDSNAPAGITLATPIEGDNRVNAAEAGDVTVNGSGAEPLSSIAVTFIDRRGATITAPATVNGDGSWFIGTTDITALDDGTVTVRAVETDQGGNAGPTVQAVVTLDTSAPSSVVINTPVMADDIVNAAEESATTVSGSNAEPSATVLVSFNDGATPILTFPAVNNGDGTWALSPVDLTPLNDSDNLIISVGTVDVAGNMATPSTTAVELDTQPPAILSISTPVEGDDIVSSAEATHVEISGTGAEDSSTVAVTVSDGMSLPIVVSAGVSPGGAWSTGNVDLSGLLDGSITITATETDDAGNVGAPRTTSVAKDTTGPVGLVINAPIEGDNIINASESSNVVVSGDGAEAGSSVAVSFSDGATVVTSPATVVNGNWQIAPVDLSPLADGPITVSAVASDAVGNAGAATSTVADLDTTAPVGIAIVTPVAGDDVINADEDNAVVVTGTGAEATSRVEVVFDSGVGVLVLPAIVNPDGSWATVSTDVSSLPEGTIAIRATETDQAGNVGAPVSVSVEHDSVVPSSIVIGTIEGDDIINNMESPNVEIRGSGAEDGSTVSVQMSDGTATVTATATVQPDGTWATSPVDSGSLSDGPVTVSVEETDSSGNTGPFITTTIRKDTVAPAGIMISAPIEGDDIINAAESLTTVITGMNAEQLSSSVMVSITDGTSMVTVPATVQDADGNWQLNNAVDVSGLNDGILTVSVRETDVAGNSGALVSRQVLHDSTAPTGMTIDNPVEGDDRINAAEENCVNLSGTSEPNSIIDVTFSDFTTVLTTTATADASGNWNVPCFDLEQLTQGPVVITTLETDPAGNAGGGSAATVQKDTLAPSGVSFNLPIEGDNVVNASEAGDVEVTGTGAEPSDTTVIIQFDDGLSTFTVPAVVLSSGDWSISPTDISSLEDGDVTITTIETDLAGNTGTITAVVTLDTKPPNPLSINEPVAGDDVLNSIEDDNVVITGANGQLGATLTVVFSDGSNTISVGGTIFSDESWASDATDLSALRDGFVSITATQTDTSATSAPAMHQVQHATAAHSGLAISLPVNGDIINAAEAIALDITGTGAAPASTVTVVVEDFIGSPIVFNRPSSPTGTWSVVDVDFTGLSDGSVAVSAFETDTFGNPGPTDTVIVTLDTTAPSGMEILRPIEGDDFINGEEANSVEVIGQGAEPTSTITVTIGDHRSLPIVVTVTPSPSGAWSIGPLDTTTLSDGPVTITAVEEDSAGNIASDSALVEKDTTGPNNARIDDPIEGDNVVNLEEEDSVVITGTGGEDGSSVEVQVSDSQSPPMTTTAAVNSDGTWQTLQLDFTSLSDGPISLTIAETDPAGNRGTPKTAVIMHDSTPPAPVTIHEIGEEGILPIGELVVTINGDGSEPTGQVAVIISDGINPLIEVDAVVNPDGSWHTDHVATSNFDTATTITVTATPTDQAGNVGGSSTETFVIDTQCGNGICDNAFETPTNCPEDCTANPDTCGNGLCDLDENFTTCPQDCANDNPPTCRNGICDLSERSSSCPEDCSASDCGNGVCEDVENAAVCPQDCSHPSNCGNGVCDLDENAGSCAQDCRRTLCGDGLCQPQEHPGNCPEDCDNIPAFTCGNGVCDASENSATCPADCSIPSNCGNGVCDLDENAGSCPQDCRVTLCGDSQCQPQETPSSCPQDCAALPPATCPNGVCDAAENSATCPSDCVLDPQLCGNGHCDTSENTGSCPSDCTVTGSCGNGVCDLNENAGNCPQECSLTQPNCGNGICNIDETPATCPQDCQGGLCGDLLCQPNEQPGTCPSDCAINPSTCGDGGCQVDENVANCAEDCTGPGLLCGDGQCQLFETPASCPEDCSLVLCGDGECQPEETFATCPDDCRKEEVTCGNGVCDPYENFVSCPQDCRVAGPPTCGNGFCEPAENFGSCPEDCAASPTNTCGSGICDDNENAGNCLQDCTATPNCGDGVCEVNENGGSCSQDCSSVVCFTNGICDPFETVARCTDCSEACNDNGVCDLNEQPLICVSDCTSPSKARLQAFVDLNLNGVLDQTEERIEGVRFYLDLNINEAYDPSSEPVYVTSGEPPFVDAALRPGSYNLRVLSAPGEWVLGRTPVTGQTHFGFTVSAGSTALVLVPFSINVPPTAFDSTVTAPAGATVTVDGLITPATDPNNNIDPTNAVVLDFVPDDLGTAILINGVIIFTPSNSFASTVPLVYRICDMAGRCSEPATITIQYYDSTNSPTAPGEPIVIVTPVIVATPVPVPVPNPVPNPVPVYIYRDRQDFDSDASTRFGSSSSSGAGVVVTSMTTLAIALIVALL